MLRKITVNEKQDRPCLVLALISNMMENRVHVIPELGANHMYEANPIFVQPEGEDDRVWRYMDFTKFVSFIESRCLYFARADKLGDPFEGSLPKMTVAAREKFKSEFFFIPIFQMDIKMQSLIKSLQQER